MSCVRYVYLRLHSEVKRRCLFISVKLRLVYNLQKKLNNWNSENFYLILFLMWLFAGDLWSFVVVCGRYIVICCDLWCFVVVCWWFVGWFVVTCGRF